MLHCCKNCANLHRVTIATSPKYLYIAFCCVVLSMASIACMLIFSNVNHIIIVRMKTFNFLLIAVLLSLTGLQAQNQFGINYQAVIRDAGGRAIPDQSVTVQLSLTNSAGSSVYYTETHATSTNAIGIVNVVLGEGVVGGGAFAAVPWSSVPVYMSVAIKVGSASDFTQFDRQPLKSVPYAIHSANGIAGEGKAGQTVMHNGTNWVVNGSVVVTDSSVNIVPKPGLDPEKPIFAVLNSKNQVIFAVYESGVRLYVGSDGVKGARGGFAIGGLSGTKGSVEYFRVTPDSTRIYIDNTTKGARGGFAIGGLSGTKGSNSNYFKVTSDSSFFSNTVFSEGDMLIAGSVSTSVGISEGLVSDFNGTTYRVVKIGTQVWMAENLRSINYSDGTSIALADQTTYNNTVSADTISAYGRLYSNNAIESASNVCPEGWHVPSVLDWKQLFTFVGGLEWGSSTSGLLSKLAEVGNVADASGLWNNPFLYQTNVTGFSAQPGGFQETQTSMQYMMMGDRAYFWTIDEGVVVFDGSLGTVQFDPNAISNMHSIRCVKY